MKTLLILLLCLCLGGCGKKETTSYDTSYEFAYKTPFYTILSYEPISEEHNIVVSQAFQQAMKFLQQDTLNKRFVVKLFHSDYAFKTYYKNKTGRTTDNNSGYGIGATFLYKNNEILIRPGNFTFGVMGHEIIHAITYINNMKLSDRESLATKFGKEWGGESYEN